MTQCIIYIQGPILNANHSIPQWDAFLASTAVGKYYITLGTDYRITNHMWQDIYAYDKRVNTSILSYPMISINENGVKFVKCPTISGTAESWFYQLFGCRKKLT